MVKGLILLGFAAFLAHAAEKPPAVPFETGAALASHGRIDDLVFAQWKRMGIQPAHACSDAVFLRRAYLDAIGTLPTPEEAAEFLKDESPDKRAASIDRLLEREEFADYGAMKWGDALRVKSEFPINLWPNAVQAYARWIRTAVRDNLPYDRFARQMLTANGSNFRAPEVNFYRCGEQRAAGHCAGGSADLHGRARGELARGAPGWDGGVLLPDWVQIDGGMERGDRILRSGEESSGRGGGFSRWQAGAHRGRAGPARGIHGVAYGAG